MDFRELLKIINQNLIKKPNLLDDKVIVELSSMLKIADMYID